MPIQDDRPCGAPSPSATLESRDSEASLLRLLDALSPNQREVIRLKFQNDLSYREIADILEIPLGTVMSRISRGKAELRARLSDLAATEERKVVPLKEAKGHG